MVQVSCAACKRPANRGYFDTANYLAPYDEGYFQNGAVFGLGDGTIARDTESALSQVPRWIWVSAGAIFLGIGVYQIYKAQQKPA